MSSFATMMERMKSLNIERITGLRPRYPDVAVEIDPDGMVMARVKRPRRGEPTLETHKIREMDLADLAGSSARTNLTNHRSLTREFEKLFQQSGLKPGRVSLILPDNLAKLSILSLPDKPASRQHLEEMLKFKVKRSIPYRIEDARLSWQILDEPHGGVRLLVGLLRRAVVEHYESALKAAGATVGLVDLCTPNLVNLYQRRLSETEGSVALLNVTSRYFSLLIMNGGTLVFYRCKNFHLGEEATSEPVSPEQADIVLRRELAASFSYFTDKLDGQGISRVFIRTTGEPFTELAERFHGLGVEDVQPLDPTSLLSLGPGLRLESSVGQRLAPVLGATVGRA